MTHYITIEQAVEAVRIECSALCGDDGTATLRDRAIEALRALPPAETSEDDIESAGAVIFNRVHAMTHRDYQGQDGFDAWRDIARTVLAALKQPGGKER